jgi:hypothetical protein
VRWNRLRLCSVLAAACARPSETVAGAVMQSFKF